MPLVIHGSPLSPFTRKVTLAALEKGLEFQSSDLNPYIETDRLAALNPLKRIPVIEHDGFTLADSSAICAYFERAFPDSLPLLSNEARITGQVLWIEEYADTALFNVISEGVFRPIFINQLMGQPPDFERVSHTVTEHLPEPLSYLDSQLDGGEWFAGEELSIADIAVYAQLVNLQHAQQLPKRDAYPALMNTMKECKAGRARPSYLRPNRPIWNRR